MEYNELFHVNIISQLTEWNKVIDDLQLKLNNYDAIGKIELLVLISDLRIKQQKIWQNYKKLNLYISDETFDNYYKEFKLSYENLRNAINYTLWKYKKKELKLIK